MNKSNPNQGTSTEAGLPLILLDRSRAVPVLGAGKQSLLVAHRQPLGSLLEIYILSYTTFVRQIYIPIVRLRNVGGIGLPEVEFFDGPKKLRCRRQKLSTLASLLL